MYWIIVTLIIFKCNIAEIKRLYSEFFHLFYNHQYVFHSDFLLLLGSESPVCPFVSYLGHRTYNEKTEQKRPLTDSCNDTIQIHL